MNRFLQLVLLTAALLAAQAGSCQGTAGILLSVQGAIGPATADYLKRGLERARHEGAGLVVLQLDTPGGLDSAMRDMIQDILQSPVAVACHVAPGGARAASAGTYLMYACHVAAMAPGTNLGAATPVEIGGLPGKSAPAPAAPEDAAADRQPADTLEAKRVNDAAAYLRSLAQLRGRNAEWAEQAVRSSASLTAQDALKLGVIDLIATDSADLLRQLDGRHVSLSGVDHVLDTQHLQLTALAPDWRNRLLAAITDPNVAYILLLIGIYGLFFEFANPGFVLPGVAGAISLLLALYAFQILPVNYAGLGLLALGLMFMLAEAFVPSFGALGIGGMIAFITGSVILFDDQGSGYAVSLPLVIGLAVTTSAFFLFIIGAAISARKRPVVSGAEEMLQASAEALEDFDSRGRVRVHGETWLAHCDRPVTRGDRLRVTAIDGLVLQVRHLSGEE